MNNQNVQFICTNKEQYLLYYNCTILVDILSDDTNKSLNQLIEMPSLNWFAEMNLTDQQQHCFSYWNFK